MLFPKIRKKLSLIVHRRTKSESAAQHEYDISSLERTSRPLSLSQVENLRPSSAPQLSSKKQYRAISAANKRLSSIQAQLVRQQEVVQALKTEAAHRDKELGQLRTQLDQRRLELAKERRKHREFEDEARVMDIQLQQCDRYFALMREIALGDLLFSSGTATDALEEAVVDAIQTAASKVASGWANILSAVIGARTSGEYVCAINATLKARREAKEHAKRAKFWKKIALKGNKGNSIVTPSPSELSDLSEVGGLQEERKQAIQELFEKLQERDTALHNSHSRLPPPSHDSRSPKGQHTRRSRSTLEASRPKSAFDIDEDEGPVPIRQFFLTTRKPLGPVQLVSWLPTSDYLETIDEEAEPEEEDPTLLNTSVNHAAEEQEATVVEESWVLPSKESKESPRKKIGASSLKLGSPKRSLHQPTISSAMKQALAQSQLPKATPKLPAVLRFSKKLPKSTTPRK